MECISELKDSLNMYFGWNKARMRGNSDTPERMALIQMFIDHFGKNCIKGILADREFVGKDWFG